MFEELELEFQRVWMLEITHRNPKADPVWFRVVNAETQDDAVAKAIALFVGQGLNQLLISNIEVTELVKLEEGGENVGQTPGVAPEEREETE